MRVGANEDHAIRDLCLDPGGMGAEASCVRPAHHLAPATIWMLDRRAEMEFLKSRGVVA
jgi:hypothetical protein